MTDNSREIDDEAEYLLDRADEAIEWANQSHEQLTEIRNTAEELSNGLESNAELLNRIDAISEEEFNEVLEAVRKVETIKQRLSMG